MRVVTRSSGQWFEFSDVGEGVETRSSEHVPQNFGAP